MPPVRLAPRGGSALMSRGARGAGRARLPARDRLVVRGQRPRERVLRAAMASRATGASAARTRGRASSRSATARESSLPRMRIENLDRVEAFVTLDGSTIREVAGPATGNAANQSLAEATVPAGGATAEHFHRTTEEVYLFTHGSGPHAPRRRGARGGRRRHRRDRARRAPQALEHRAPIRSACCAPARPPTPTRTRCSRSVSAHYTF